MPYYPKIKPLLSGFIPISYLYGKMQYEINAKVTIVKPTQCTLKYKLKPYYQCGKTTLFDNQR